MTFHEQLKKQTLDLHNQAHKIPYIINLLKNDIQLISYIGHLRSLAIIYGTLEHQLYNSENKEIKIFLENYTPKLPLILSDLEFLKANEEKDIIPAISIALSIADKILMNSEGNLYKLLGFIYILEGSINGGNILKKHISETFRFTNNDGTKYLSCFDDKFKSFWEDFVNKLNIKINENKQKEDIIAAANEIFHNLMKIYEELSPIDESKLGNHITSLNPEAGNYPISTNPLEIKAAMTAGLQCWNEFPYYEKRYGERGRRFAVSDSAWLITLSCLPEEEAIKQAEWLSRFLSIRGMPSYTMEIQLRFLYIELSKLIPKNEQKYLKLLKTSEHIKQQRIIHVSDKDFDNCNLIFEKYFTELKVTGKFCSELKINIGKLIASSIIDDENGIPDARKSLESWLISKEIFTENWLLAVEKSYKKIETFLK